MALSNSSPTRQNIRIEIQNNFTENMDEDMIDDNELSEGEVEDGEISDSKSPEATHEQTKNKLVIRRNISTSRIENNWINGERGFTTGIDIFSHDEQEKLQNRAERFGLDPSERKAMTDDLLQELYDSLGLTTVDQDDTRFDTIHMYGTQDMSTQDIFDYFGKYGPASIEWINDTSCNVVWHDKISVARAFIALSKPIKGMPVTGDFKQFNEENEKLKFNKGRSILLINETMDQDKENNSNDGTIHVSEIDIPIPPGYWRFGDPHEKSKTILLRFAKLTDKKPYRAERFNEHHKKFGNSKFAGMPGLISASRKRKIKEVGYKDLDKPEPEVIKGNPWGNLARNWDHDIQETVIPPRIQEPIKIALKTGPSKALLTRIGETQKSESESEDESEEKAKKSKVPRMRMYADEEEAKLRRRLELKQIKRLEEIEQKMTKLPDLRSRLGKKDIKEERRRLELPKTIPKSISKPLSIPQPKTQTRKPSSSSEYSDEEINVQQRSKVAVVVRRTSSHKPTVASTVWSRLDRERQNRIQIKREISDSEKRNNTSESSSATSDSDDKQYSHRYRRTLSKTVNERPGFKTADLKSRLGFQATEHKSPLRIEISNDHYKKEKP